MATARGRTYPGAGPQLCNEALRIGRVLTSVAPHESEPHGLLALIELNASRASVCAC
jgi:predicted RNA polymerase sigma factor